MACLRSRAGSRPPRSRTCVAPTTPNIASRHRIGIDRHLASPASAASGSAFIGSVSGDATSARLATIRGDGLPEVHVGATQVAIPAFPQRRGVAEAPHSRLASPPAGAAAARWLRLPRPALTKLKRFPTNGAHHGLPQRQGENDNVEDRRGQGGRGLRGGGKIGIGTIVLALVAMYFGIDPSVVPDTAMTDPAPVESTQTRPPPRTRRRASCRWCWPTPRTPGGRSSSRGATYREPKLVFTPARRAAPAGRAGGDGAVLLSGGRQGVSSTWPSSTSCTTASARPATLPRRT